MDMKQAKLAADRARQDIGSRQGVVSIGYGFKRKAGQLTDIPCVVVYVKEKRPLSALTAADIIPAEIEGTPSDVVQVKTVNALSHSTGSGQVFHAVYPGRKRPCPGGYSIGHPLVTAGSLGLPVVMKDGKKALLTNAHVAAPHWLGDIKAGDPVYQPGPYDGGKPEDSIAILHSWIPIDAHMPNQVDCALALISESRVDWRLEAIPEVYEKAGEPQPGDRVIKVGRTTGLTTGRVSAVGAAINVNYGLFTALFTDQIEVVPVENKPFSAGGDSGSAVLSADGKDVLGLLFAGNDTTTYANPIKLVRQALGFDIVKPVTIDKQLEGLNESLVMVWAFDARTQQWLVYNPVAPVEVNTLKALVKAKGYWVRVAREVSFSYHGQDYDLAVGWNLMGWMD